MNEDLLALWAAFEGRSAPYILDADRPSLERAVRQGEAVVYTSWNQVISDPQFEVPGDTRLHLGLFPGPFVGDLKRASIYLLLLNPGLRPVDYFGEYEVPGFRQEVLRNFHQQHDPDSQFMFLDPRFSWTGGFDWWHGKLAGVIDELRTRWSVPFAEARRRLAREVACIEMVPYHSASFQDRGNRLLNLPSARAARAFVLDYVLPRVRRKEAIVIVTRRVDAWQLPEGEDGIVLYSRPGEARGAHLSPNSRGGQAIIDHLSRRQM